MLSPQAFAALLNALPANLNLLGDTKLLVDVSGLLMQQSLYPTALQSAWGVKTFVLSCLGARKLFLSIYDRQSALII
jgi:hypothetical protein